MEWSCIATSLKRSGRVRRMEGLEMYTRRLDLHGLLSEAPAGSELESGPPGFVGGGGFSMAAGGHSCPQILPKNGTAGYLFFRPIAYKYPSGSVRYLRYGVRDVLGTTL